MSRRGRNDLRDPSGPGGASTDRLRARPHRTSRAGSSSWRLWFSGALRRPLAVAVGCAIAIAITFVVAAPGSLLKSRGDGGFEERVQRWTFTPRSERAPTFSKLSDSVLHRLLSAPAELSRFDPNEPSSLIAPILVPRISGTSSNAKVKNYIADFFRDRLKGSWSVEEDSFEDTTPYGKKRFTNVIATKDPSARRRVVLAAHFDSKYFENFDFYAATDSAAPCAILLDVAAHLDPHLDARSKRGVPEVTLQFIFFDGEEAFKDWTATDSIYGSRHLAAKWESEPGPGGAGGSVLDSIEVFVLLDLLGSPNPHIHNYFDATAAAYGRMQDAQRRVEAKARSLAAARGMSYAAVPQFFVDDASAVANYGVADDHVPFLTRGVPILHLIPVPFPSVWHTERDNANALDTLTMDGWSRVMRVWAAEEIGLGGGMSNVMKHT